MPGLLSQSWESSDAAGINNTRPHHVYEHARRVVGNPSATSRQAGQTTSTITVSHAGMSGLANNLELSMKKFAIAFLAVAFVVAVGCGPTATTAPKATTPAAPTEKGK
jgi:hypothetical protein